MIFIVVVHTGDYPDDEMWYNSYVGTDANKAEEVAQAECSRTDWKSRGIGNSLRGVYIEIWSNGVKIKEIDRYD